MYYVITDFDIENRRRRIAIEIEMIVPEAVLKSLENINSRNIEKTRGGNDEYDLPF